MAPVATEFEKIIHSARERKKNEALASRIFSSNRPSPKPARGSLASRVGISKPAKTKHHQPSRPSQRPRGDVNGEWTHDLHESPNPKPARASSASLQSRITAKPTAFSSKKRTARVTAALDRIEKQNDTISTTTTNTNTNTNTSTNTRPSYKRKNDERPTNISIRGLAGPFAVMAQNFAPGTTAADIESAMTPVGGEMVSCTVVKTQPIMLVEMVFYSREGGEKVIDMFHNKTADGRVIQVFAKPGGYQPEPAYPSHSHSSYTRQHDARNGSGYEEDLMAGNGHAADDRLYSDRVVNKRGRGFQRE